MLKRFAAGLLLATASATMSMAADLVVEAAPVEPPAPAVSGDVSIYLGSLYIDDIGDDSTYNGTTYGVAGRVNLPIAPEISIQADLSGEKLNGDYAYSVYDLAGHVSWRKDGVLVGTFASVGVDEDWWDETVATGGVEGQVTMDNVQLYGQLGYTASVGGDDDISAWFVHGEARYFVTPNLQLTGSVGVLHQEYHDGDPLEGVNWGASAEYRFDDSPISIFASYVGNYETEDQEDEKWATHALLVGAKFSFGSESLQDAAVNGATLRDYNPITGYGFDRYNNFE